METGAFTFGFCAFVPPALAAPLTDRIGHYVPENTQHLSAVHDGAGSMNVAAIMDGNWLSTHLLFWHRGVIAARRHR